MNDSTQHPIIYWFRNDLRFTDNKAFFEAAQTGRSIIPVYIFDESLFTNDPLEFKRCGKYRLNYLNWSVNSFAKQIELRNGTLLIFRGNTVDILSHLFKQLDASAIYAHHEFAHEELVMEQLLTQQFKLNLFWGNMLYSPDEIPLSAEQSPYYFTAFKKRVTSLKDSFQETDSPSEIKWHNADLSNVTIKPVITTTDTSPANSFIYGEEAALAHLNSYFKSDRIHNYITTRELFEGEGFSTQLSPWLAIGALSPVTVINKLNEIKSDDDMTNQSINKLKEQLIWRDYYRWLFLRYKTKIFRKKGLRTVVLPQYNDKETFELWKNGQTNEPLVNALMHELNTTGFMSNRGRMIAAYYLSKKLSVNWLWGARYFESQLIDYDVCNNYGNWAYQSGTGTDSRINRSFSLKKQAAKFDVKGQFTAKWNPGITQ